MSELCDNHIVIFGDKDKISTLKNDIQTLQDNSNSNDMNSNTFFYDLLGVPERTEEYHQNWTEINKKVFGTKSDVDIQFITFHFDDYSIEMNMETTWTPPTNFLKLLCTKYGLDGKLTYFEFTNDYSGLYECFSDGTENSEEFSYLEGLYLNKNDVFWDEIDYKIYDLAEMVIESSVNEEMVVSKNQIMSVVSDELWFLNSSDFDNIVNKLSEHMSYEGYETEE